jgi:hypothetical protein
MSPFPRFSTLTPGEWAIAMWFFASLICLVWLRFERPRAPLWLRLACVLNLLAALVVYRSVLW